MIHNVQSDPMWDIKQTSSAQLGAAHRGSAVSIRLESDFFGQERL